MIAACWRTGLHLALWAAVGAGAMLTALTALTIGVFVLPGTAALAALAAWRGDRRLAAGRRRHPGRPWAASALHRLPEPRWGPALAEGYCW